MYANKALRFARPAPGGQEAPEVEEGRAEDGGLVGLHGRPGLEVLDDLERAVVAGETGDEGLLDGRGPPTELLHSSTLGVTIRIEAGVNLSPEHRPTLS